MNHKSFTIYDRTHDEKHSVKTPFRNSGGVAFTRVGLLNLSMKGRTDIRTDENDDANIRRLMLCIKMEGSGLIGQTMVRNQNFCLFLLKL